MAVCRDCDQEMTTADGCRSSRVVVGGRTVVRRRWRPERGAEQERCGDCGASPGGWHHLGCDLEPCPLCRRQLITCDCSGGDDEEEDDETAEPRLRAVPR